MQSFAAQNSEILEISSCVITSIILRNIHESPAAFFICVQQSIENLNKIADGDAASGIQHAAVTCIKISDMFFCFKCRQITRSQRAVKINRKFSALFFPVVRILPEEEGLSVEQNRFMQSGEFAIQVFLCFVRISLHHIGHGVGCVFSAEIKQKSEDRQQGQDACLHQPETLSALSLRNPCCRRGTGFREREALLCCGWFHTCSVRCGLAGRGYSFIRQRRLFRNHGGRGKPCRDFFSRFTPVSQSLSASTSAHPRIRLRLPGHPLPSPFHRLLLNKSKSRHTEADRPARRGSGSSDHRQKRAALRLRRSVLPEDDQ